METIDRTTLTPADERALLALWGEVWPQARSPRERYLREWETYAGPAHQRPRCLVVRREGRIAAVARLFPREIATGDGRLTILALAGVCSAPAERGCGYGQAVVRAAFDLVDRGHFPWSLFQTTPDVRPFYERLGACSASNRFINSLADDPEASAFWDNEVMRYPHKRGWPTGVIDMLGGGY